MRISLAWEESFPKGYGHTSLAYLKRCPGFEDAKKGDPDAAAYVVSRCVKQNRIHELREKYPDAVLIPVLGQNQLPLALALEIGLPVWRQVRLVPIVCRKVLCALRRLLHKPVFVGCVQKDCAYILVDDVVTQGGTVAALREFVMTRGGRVVAVAALAYAIGSHDVAPTKRHMIRLMVKFGLRLIVLLHILGVVSAFRELTNSQAKYLLRFSSVGNIMKRLAAIG